MSEPSPLRRLLPVFIGMALTIILLVALGYLAQQRRQAAPLALPIHIVTPTENAAVDSPLVVRFTTPEPLALHPTGWGTDRLHLHARVGAVEHMPAASDIVADDSGFVWTLPTVPRGSHTLRLGWADTRHREISAGASPTLHITVR